MDATAAITLSAEGEWLSDTLDVFFGKRDFDPGAVVFPNRSARDALLNSFYSIRCPTIISFFLYSCPTCIQQDR